MIAAIPYNIYRQKTPLFSLTSSISFQILFFNKKTAGNTEKTIKKLQSLNSNVSIYSKPQTKRHISFKYQKRL